MLIPSALLSSFPMTLSAVLYNSSALQRPKVLCSSLYYNPLHISWQMTVFYFPYF